MNKYSYIIFILLCLSITRLNAQSQTADERFIEAMSALDMTPVTAGTGLFLDRVPSVIPLHLFHGAAISDTLRGSRGLLLIAHASMYGADLGVSPLDAPDTYVAKLDHYAESDTVMLGAMLYQYDRLRLSAVADSLIYYDGMKFRHTDTLNTAAVFVRDTLAVLGTTRLTTGTDTVIFMLPADLYTSNISGVIGMDIDYGDGLGFRAIVPGQAYTVTYATADTFRIDIRWMLSDSTYRYASTSIIVVDATAAFGRGLIGQLRMLTGYSNAPDRVHTITTSPGCDIYIWDNKDCGGQVRKPLILIKGFDPTNSIQPSYVMDGKNGLLDNEYGFEDSNGERVALKDLIHGEGYTLYFITMHNSTALVQDNAATTKAAIDWINAQKAAAGSTEKNIVIGASMGGLIGKWALREYELHGLDHETELFISYDSPLKGANIPLALQAIPIALGERNVLGYSLDKFGAIKTGRQAVTSPAARQMLYYYLGDCREGCTAAALSAEHDAFYAALEARGNLSIPHVALSNGSMTGEGMPYGPGVQLIDHDLLEGDLGEGSIWVGFTALGISLYPPAAVLFAGNHIAIIAEGYAMPGFPDNGQYVIAKNSLRFYKFGVKLYSSTDIISLNATDAQANSLPGYIWYDHAPGGLRKFQSDKKTKDNEKGNQGWLYHSFCFIPTVSALDLPTGTDPFADVSDRADILDAAPHLRSAVASEDAGLYYGHTQTNMPHVTLNNKIATFLLSNLKSIDLNDDLVLSDRTFNFGNGDYDPAAPLDKVMRTTNHIKKNLIITDTGKLWINGDDRIAYTDITANVFNNTGTHFDVTMGKDICGSTASEVTVADGGELSIGQWPAGNTGRLILTDDTKLTIDDGGILRIDSRSGLVIKAGAVVELMPGARVIVSGHGYIHVQPGASLILHDGAAVALEDAMAYVHDEESTHVGSVIRLEGNLHAPDGIVKVEGQGFIWILPGHSFTSPTGSLRWRGHGTSHTAFRVDAQVNLQGIDFAVEQAKVMVNRPVKVSDADNISITSSAFHAKPIDLIYDSPAYYAALADYNQNAIHANNIHNIHIERSVFEDVPVYSTHFDSFVADAVESSTQRKAHNFRFDDGGTVLFTASRISTTATISTWDDHGPRSSKTGINTTGVLDSRFTDCVLSGFNYTNGRNVDPAPNREYIAIRHERSPYLFMENTILLNSYVGVYAPDAVNVVMDHCKISHCDKGIEMTGTVSTGLVKMLCSELTDNHYGIFGTDITLAIDGLINSQTTQNGAIAENVFDNLGLHFWICYTLKDFEDVILARYNRWVSPDKHRFGICNLNDPSSYASLVQAPYGIGSCAGKELADCDAVTPVFPIRHVSIPSGQYDSLFIYNITTCIGDTIMEPYWRGYSCYYNGDLNAAITHLTPLSKDYFSVKDLSYPLAARHILAEAHAFTGGLSDYGLNQDSYTLTIIPECVQDSAGVFSSRLRVEVPAFMEPYDFLKWRADDGGDIISNAEYPVITTNATGNYTVIIGADGCTYTTTFDYILLPDFCNNTCISDTLDLAVDTLSCALLSTAYNTYSMDSTVIFGLQSFNGHQWIPAGFTYIGQSMIPTHEGLYRLVMKGDSCRQASYPVYLGCSPEDCPDINITFVDDNEEENGCYNVEIRATALHQYSFIIRTWQTDTSVIQFTDTLIFFAMDTAYTFSYCDLPPEYQCYNYGDILISCLDCDLSCVPYTYSWSCIPRHTGSDDNVKNTLSVQYSPNPFSSGLYMLLTSDRSEQMTLSAYNTTGSRILNRQLDVRLGKNHTYLHEFESLPSGVYTIVIFGQSRQYTSKVIKID